MQRHRLHLTAGGLGLAPNPSLSSDRVMGRGVFDLAMKLIDFYGLRCIAALVVCTTLFLPALLAFQVDPGIFQLKGSAHYVPLQFAFACSLATTLPLFMDISLDYFNFPGVAFLNHRILSTLVLAISNVVILIYFNSSQTEMIMLTSFLWSYLLEFMIILSSIHALSDLKSSFILKSSRFFSFSLLYVFFLSSILSETVEYGGGAQEKVAIAAFVLFTSIHFLKTILVFRSHYQSFVQSQSTLMEWYSNVDDKKKFLQLRLNGFGIQLIVLYVVFFGVRSTSASCGLFHDADLFYLIIVRTFFFMFEYFVSARIFRGKLIRSNQDLAFKTQLIKYFSHEMRSPIMVMTVGLDLIAGSIMSLRNQNIISPIRIIEDSLSDVRSSCEHSLEILDGMLLYEKIEKGTVVPDFLTTDPLKGIRELLKVHESAAKSMQVSIFLEFCQEEFARNKRRLSIDASKLRHVFSAILSSVFKKVGTKYIARSSNSQPGSMSEEIPCRDFDSRVERDEVAADSTVECAVNRQNVQPPRLSSNDICFRAFIDADIDAMRSVLKSRLRKQTKSDRNFFGNAYLPSWLHIEMSDSYGNISDEDIADMNSHTLDFSRKG